MGEFEAQSNILAELAQKYEKCCGQMYTIVLLYDKYQLSKNNKVLGRITEKLEQTYEQEKDILDAFIAEATNVYTNFLIQRK